jgi:hypothetical protein
MGSHTRRRPVLYESSNYQDTEIFWKDGGAIMSVVNIKYNNKLIASTNQNKTYTLNCANQIMDSDLVIEIVEESLKYELNTSGNSYKVAGLGNM